MIVFSLQGGALGVRMDNKCFRIRKSLAVLSVVSYILVMLLHISHGKVILIGNNASFSIEDMEASFVPPMKGSGQCGILQVAEPFDACSPLRNKAVSGEGLYSPFALIQRGSCSFETKIRHAQHAGFKAAIIYNNEESPNLVAMGGNSTGLTIYAVFVSKIAGQLLLRYAGDQNMECWIIPSLNTSWSVMLISFAALISMAAVLAIFLFLRKSWLQHSRHRNLRRLQVQVMSRRRVKALQTLIFYSVTNDNCTSETCAICLEDYTSGQRLRVLPCRHKFHACCIDQWLTRWRTFCPVCKCDARTRTGGPPVTENTPLLDANSLISSQSQSRQPSFISVDIPPSSLLCHAEPSYSNYSQIASSCMAQTLASHCSSSILSHHSSNVGNTSLMSLGIPPSGFSSQLSLCVSQHSSFNLLPPIPTCSDSPTVISPINSTNALPGCQECYV